MKTDVLLKKSISINLMNLLFYSQSAVFYMHNWGLFYFQPRPTEGCRGGPDVRQVDRGVPKDPENKNGHVKECGALSGRSHVGSGKWKPTFKKLFRNMA